MPRRLSPARWESLLFIVKIRLKDYPMLGYSICPLIKNDKKEIGEWHMNQSKQNFSNGRAKGWDEVRAVDVIKIANLVEMVEFKEGDIVLDIGSGTGVLMPLMKDAIGKKGLITEIDFAANMIDRAIEKNCYLSGITYIVGDIMKFQSEKLFDKVIYLNFFSHVLDKLTFMLRIRELLAPNGSFIIMHDLSRATVNGIHQGSDVVKKDRLPKGLKVAEMLSGSGYEIEAMLDNDELYFIKAVKKD